MRWQINFRLLLLVFVSITTNTLIAQKQKVSIKDSIALNKLAINLYKWRHDNPIEFIAIGKPDINNIKYETIDWVKYDNHKKTLRETGFFTEEFLKNYRKILSKINKKLKTNEYEWLIGQVAPFDYEADIWCNCIQYPKPKKYWTNLAIKKLRIKKDGTVKFKLCWLEDKKEQAYNTDFKYKVTAIKENGAWKIKTLEGFNKKDY